MHGGEMIRLIKLMPNLETPRMVLRKLVPRDASDMYEYSSNSNVTRFLTWTEHESLRYTKQYIRYIISRYRTGDFLDWGIVLKSNDKMIGTCGLTSIDTENSRAEIGYVLNPDYWNNGYASEAVRAVIEYLFNVIGVNKVEARIMTGNLPSASVLKKCGLRFEGCLKQELFVKGRYVDVEHFGICKDEYLI